MIAPYKRQWHIHLQYYMLLRILCRRLFCFSKLDWRLHEDCFLKKICENLQRFAKDDGSVQELSRSDPDGIQKQAHSVEDRMFIAKLFACCPPSRVQPRPDGCGLRMQCEALHDTEVHPGFGLLHWEMRQRDRISDDGFSRALIEGRRIGRKASAAQRTVIAKGNLEWRGLMIWNEESGIVI